MACVLIVEDDPDIRDFMQFLLSSSGYETMTAANGREALERMRERTPCMVLLDLMMPVMDGWQFLSERSADAASPKVPVVLLSGLPFIPNAIGVSDFLSKPINPSRLLDCVARFCRRPGA